MSEKKYYVVLKLLDVDDETIYLTIWKEEGVSDEPYFYPEKSEQTHKQAKNRFTKSELAEIMGGVLYRTSTNQFNPELAEELYKLGYKTTQTTEEWIEAKYEFDNIWEWINPLIELVPVEDGE